MEPEIEGPALWGTAEDCEPRPGRSVAWRRGASGRPVLHRAALRLCRRCARGFVETGTAGRPACAGIQGRDFDSDRGPAHACMELTSDGSRSGTSAARRPRRSLRASGLVLAVLPREGLYLIEYDC